MKNDLINKMREESESEHVAYTEFILSYKLGEEKLYCFYEGLEDKRYYGIRIRHVTKKNYENFTCGGKDNVYKAYNLIKRKNEYKEAKTIFFVDKDFYTHTTHNEIYCLPCYSIENLYSNTEVLKNILTHEFELSENHPDFKKTVFLFENIQNLFHSSTLFFNAWLSCQSDLRQMLGIKTNLKIDKTVNNYFESIVSLDLQSISDFSDLNNLSKLEELFPEAPKVGIDKLSEKIKIYNEVDKWQNFRGKFELKLIISFLSRLKDEIGKKKSSIFNDRHRCNLKFEVATAISSLTQYALEPECLIKFLEKYKITAA